MNKTTLKEAQQKVVATAVRVEVNQQEDEYFLVFQIKDPEFKNKIKRDWMQDIDLVLIGKNLVESK
jgi:hypothetical protein